MALTGARWSSYCTPEETPWDRLDAPPLRLAPLDDDVLQVLGAEPDGALAEERLVDGPGIFRQQRGLQLEDLGCGRGFKSR